LNLMSSDKSSTIETISFFQISTLSTEKDSIYSMRMNISLSKFLISDENAATWLIKSIPNSKLIQRLIKRLLLFTKGISNYKMTIGLLLKESLNLKMLTFNSNRN
jgi:hypothetical protein